MHEYLDRAVGYISDFVGDIVKCLRKKRMKHKKTKSQDHEPQFQTHVPQFQDNQFYQTPYQENQLYQESNQNSVRYHPQFCPYVQ